jgi:hypothetical protein
VEDFDDAYVPYSILPIEDVSDFDDSFESPADYEENEASSIASSDEEFFPTHEKASSLSEFKETWGVIHTESWFDRLEWVDFILKHNSSELASFFTIEAAADRSTLIRDIAQGLSEIWVEHPSYVMETMIKIYSSGEIKQVLENASYEAVPILRNLLDLVVVEYPDLVFTV